MLFLDEIHRMSRPAEEMLYMAMEDFRVDVIVGKGPGATAIPLELPPFTLVGATTRSGLLPAPLRDRFGFTAHMEFYEPAELEQVVHRSARLLGVRDRRRRRRRDRRRAPGARRVSPTGCCAGSATSPQVKDDGGSPWRSPRAALAVYEVDERGLDRLDRAVLDALLQAASAAARSACPRWRSRSARRPTPSRRSPSRSWSAQGLLARTPRGRIATAAAWEHLGLRRRRPPSAAVAARPSRTLFDAVPRRLIAQRSGSRMTAFVGTGMTCLALSVHGGSPRLRR